MDENEVRRKMAQMFTEQIDSMYTSPYVVSQPHQGGKYTDLLSRLETQIKTLRSQDTRPYGNKTCIVLNHATYSDMIPLIPNDDELFGFPARAAGYISGMRYFRVAYIYIDGVQIPLKRGDVILANEDILPQLLGDQYKPFGEKPPEDENDGERPEGQDVPDDR